MTNEEMQEEEIRQLRHLAWTTGVYLNDTRDLLLAMAIARNKFLCLWKEEKEKKKEKPE